MPSLKGPSSGMTSRRRSSSRIGSQSKQQQCPDSEDIFAATPLETVTSQYSSIRNKSKNNQSLQPDNVLREDSIFCKYVSEAGMVLHTDDSPNILSCDHVKFKQSINKKFNSNLSFLTTFKQNMPINSVELDEFLSGLEMYLNKPHRLKWSLLYTETAPDCDVAGKGNQDSLVRLLLNVDVLQPKLVTLLTDTLLSLAYEQSDAGDSSLPSLVLGNLRWLDHIVEPESLSDAIIMVLLAATEQVQREIISFIPNIITDEFHERVADAFTELYTSRPSLVPAILDSLLHLNLSESNLAAVHHSVLNNLHATEPQHLPCVVKFILHFTPQTSSYQVLRDVREKLHLPKEEDVGGGPSIEGPSSEGPSSRPSSSSENAGIAVLVCSAIKMALLLKKFLVNSWLKVIDDVECDKMRAEDLLLLVVMHDAFTARRRPIHSILRNKIRTGLQYDALLQAALACHPAVKQEYFDSIKKLAGVMIRSPEPACSQFGVTLYRISFETSARSASLQQEVVMALLAHMGDDQHVRLNSLRLLASLSHSHTLHMARFAIHLKSSLEQLERLSLQESRCLLDAVCAVAESDNTTALHAELAIHTRKMLNHPDVRYKRLGVLSAVLTLKNSHESSATQDSGGSGLSAGGEDILEVVRVCTASCPPASALFMDELASTILRDGINPKLERWLSGKLEESFENVFVVDLDPETPQKETSHMHLPVQLAFDLEVEEQAAIVLNLATLVEQLELHRRQEKTSKSARTSALGSTDAQLQTIILTLAPHFRLLRMLVCHLNAGDLTAIDGLLGCPLYYPHSDLLVPEAFVKLPPEKQTLVISCLFFASNWFRELVNAFVTQKAPELKRKVYARLRNLLEVEQTLSKLLPLCPSYEPHLVASHVDPNTSITLPSAAGAGTGAPKKKGRKPKANKKVKQDTASTTAPLTQASQMPASILPSQPPASQPPDIQPQVDKPLSCDLSACAPFLRELHLDVFSLLFKTMCLDPDLQAAGNQLSVLEADFLLTDLNMKLAHVFGADKRSSALGKSTDNKEAGFWHLNLFSAEELATQTQRYVKPICVHLDKINAFFSSLIADHDGVLDCSGVLNDRTLPIARVQGLLLTSLQLLLAWPQLPRHELLCSYMLRVICRKTWPERSVEDVQALPTEHLLWGVFCYARRQIHALLELGSAVLLVRLLEVIVSLARKLGFESVPEERQQESEDVASNADTSSDSRLVASFYGHKLGEVVCTLLQRNWTTAADGLPDKGPLFNQRVAHLLQCWFRTNPRPLKVIQQITVSGIDEYMSSSNSNPSSEAFPTLNKHTLVIYLSCLLSNLSPSVKKALAVIDTSSLSDDLSTQEESVRSLAVWSSAVEVYTKLIRVVKKHHSRSLLSACLKFARPFLELFLSLGMPLMDSSLKDHKDDVCQLLKTLQSATRILQIICTESKVKKDVSLTSYVPLIRRSLATLVFRVKAMLVHHNCSRAFWLGVLKNRNLDGEIIATQAGDTVPAEREGRGTSTPTDDSSLHQEEGEAEHETDSPEDVELDELSDIELEDDNSSEDRNAKGTKKRKSVAESDDDEEEQEEDEEETPTVDGATDYSTSF